MKCFAVLFQEMLAFWLLCLIAGSSCAIFYTKSSDEDSNYPRIGRRAFFTQSTDNYPRIGRRAFFTDSSKGSNYPRIGRSSGPMSSLHADDDSSDVMPGADNQFLGAAKRGIFTDGAGGYPRIGRRNGSGSSSSNSNSLARTEAGEAQGELSAVAALMTSPDAADEEEVLKAVEVPLGLLFFAWDKDGDKTLSRSEFVAGMTRARADGTACR